MNKPTGRRGAFRPNYKRNHGRPGVVYILENDGLRAGWLKIGCSTRSGATRARELNDDANTGTPGAFRCVFEYRTVDCGLAEELVFDVLAHARAGKWGQEYFVLDVEVAEEVVRRVCLAVSRSVPQLTPPPPAPAFLHHTQSETVLPAPRPPAPRAVQTSEPAAAPSRQPLTGPRNFLCDKCRRVVNLNVELECSKTPCRAKELKADLDRSEGRRRY